MEKELDLQALMGLGINDSIEITRVAHNCIKVVISGDFFGCYRSMVSFMPLTPILRMVIKSTLQEVGSYKKGFRKQ